jgi:hypothetical protein
MAALIIANVESFTAAVAYRIIVPGRKPEFMGVFRPGVGHAAFGHNCAEHRISQNINPGRRCYLFFGGGNNILAPVRSKSAQTVKEQQIMSRQRGRRRRRGAVSAAWYQARHRYFQTAALFDLVDQFSLAAGNNHISHGLKKDSVFFRHLIGISYENSAGPVFYIGDNPRGNKSHDLIMQKLPVSGVIFVPDDKVNGESFQSPVGVSLNKLTRQFYMGLIGNL